MEVEVALAARRLRFYVDDVSIIDVAMSDTAPRYSQVQVGLTRTDMAGAHVFIDDVVVA